jgi:hypothetical protein
VKIATRLAINPDFKECLAACSLTGGSESAAAVFMGNAIRFGED